MPSPKVFRDSVKWHTKSGILSTTFLKISAQVISGQVTLIIFVACLMPVLSQWDKIGSFLNVSNVFHPMYRNNIV